MLATDTKYSDILTVIDHQDWLSPTTCNHAIHDLEQGKILLFPSLPFLLLPHEEKFLSPDYVAPNNKNISYDSKTQLLRGYASSFSSEYDNLKKMLHRYATQATTFIRHLFPLYYHALEIGRTSFRPVEISGRMSSYRKDDTRLHVDAFPATPNQGRRILRVFTNLNPHGQARIWRIGEPFEAVAKRFLPKVSKPIIGSATLLKLFKMTKSRRTEYDHIMLRIHDGMKADLSYQKNVSQHEVHFLPNNSWVVQTDHVSHAAMSGQYLLEQTFYLPITAMNNPNFSPLHILQKLSGRILV